MVSFRKSILAIAVLALFAGLASAQVNIGSGSTSGSMNCNLVSIGTTLRSEGVTELTGDVQLQCSGGPQPVVGATVPTATITVTLSAPITSRILGSGGASEVALLIDEPGSTNTGAGALIPQTIIPSSAQAGNSYVVGTGTNANGTYLEAACTASDGTCGAGTVPNVFQGNVLLNGSNPSYQIQFPNVPILAPGTTGSRVFRITNIRVAASSVSSSFSSFGSGQVQAYVSVTNNVNSITPGSAVVGTVQPGLSTSTGVIATNGSSVSSSNPLSSLQFLQCNGANNVAGAELQFTANFAGAFKTRVAATGNYTGLSASPIQNMPGNQSLYSESGFVLPGLTGNGATAGLADFGTRLRAVFTNIPAGVTVYVTTSNVNGGGALGSNTNTLLGYTLNNVSNGATNNIALLVLSPTVPDYNGGVQQPYSATTIGNTTVYPVPLTVSNNVSSGEAVWEVVQGTIQSGQSVDFGVFFSYPAGISSVGAPTPTVDLSYAPADGYGVNDYPTAYENLPATMSQAPIPRFVDFGTHTATIANWGLCQTTLLFPYVTNTAGFETGISIANTSADTLGTPTQAGTCTMTFFGTGDIIQGTTTNYTQAAVTTPSIPAGAVWADTLTHATGGTSGTFEGYMFATCNFQYAHGFAFITDSHATNLAMGYLALVINNGGTVPVRSTKVGGEGTTF